MKRSVIGVLLVLLLAPATSLGQASSYFEVQTGLEQGQDAAAYLDGGVAKMFPDSNFGAAGYFWLEKTWVEAYAGPTYIPVDGLQIGAHLGAEQMADEMFLRYALTLFANYGSTAFAGVIDWNNHLWEGDDSCIWFDVVERVNVWRWFDIGARVRRGAGAGPYAQFFDGGTNLTIWAAYLFFEPEKLSGSYWHESRAFAGISLGF